MDARSLESMGLGLRHGTLRFVHTPPEWSAAGQRLVDGLAAQLGDHAADIQHVGSTAVTGLLAKPILDIAAVLVDGAPTDEVTRIIEQAGWDYFGDSGDHGGLVFVLRPRPESRVAHLHVLQAGDPQWRDYLQFRDRLRTDPAARDSYEATKIALAPGFIDDPESYSEGKTALVNEVLSP